MKKCYNNISKSYIGKNTYKHYPILALEHNYLQKICLLN